MSNIRIKHKNKWYISPRVFKYALNYALMYNEWKEEYEAIGGISAINQDGLPHGHSTESQVESDAIRAAELFRKLNLIDMTILEAASDIHEWIKLAVTNDWATFPVLKAMGMPCERDMFYNRRRRFYYLLSKKI